MNLRTIIVGYFLFYSFAIAMAQQPATWHLSDKNGLPSTTIYRITQDSIGYIWIGTANGLCRFDGEVFDKFKGSQLADNEILTLTLDDSGVPWILNLAGEVSYLDNNLLVPFPHIPDDYIIKNLKVANNRLWVVYNAMDKFNKLTSFSLDNSPIKTPIELDSLSFMSNSIFTQLGKDRLLFLAGKSSEHKEFCYLNQLSLSQNNFQKIQRRAYDFYENIRRISSINLTDAANLSKQEIGEIIQNLATAIQNLNYKTQIKDIVLEDHEFYLLTRSGLYHYKHDLRNSDQISLIAHLLPNQEINCLFKDKDGNIWLGTNEDGIHVISLPKFITYNSKNSALPVNSVYCLYYDTLAQQLMLGQNNSFLSIIQDQKVKRSIKLKNVGRIVDIIKTPNQRYWLGVDLGLSILDRNLKNERTPFSGSYKTFMIDQRNNIWLGGSGIIKKTSLSDIDSLIKENASDTILKNSFSLMNTYRTYALLQDFSGNIWVGTTRGLFKYVQDSLVLVELGIHNDKSNITDIIQSKDSVIWVSTYSSGVIGLKGDSIIQHFHSENKLISNTSRTIFYATDQSLWVGTDNGVNVIQFPSLESRWINIDDGLAANEINDIYVDKDLAWIATNNGLTKIDLSEAQTSTTVPSVMITRVQVSYRDTTLHSRYNLKHYQNNLKIDFLALNYENKEKLSYRYKMEGEGLDENWISTQSRFVRYPFLIPGRYTFQIYAVNEDKLKNPHIEKIDFIIETPWWKTSWFRILVFLLISGLVGTLFYLRLRFLKREQEHSNRIHGLKMDALKAQMNPHFIFNSLIAIQKYITTNEQEQANTYLSRFAKLIRMIFNQSDKQAIRLSEELEFLKTYIDLEKLRFGEKVSIRLQLDPELNLEADNILVPPLLIQPIIENAFKHGLMHKEKNGLLVISLKRKLEYLVCSVKDNGVGRLNAQKVSSNKSKNPKASGLNTTKNRLVIWNNSKEEDKNIEIIDYTDQNGRAEGTEVLLYIRI